MSVEVNQKLQSSRKELLDIGMRNSMLNFRTTAKTLQIVDERSYALFDLMYRQQKEMSFSAISEKKAKEMLKAIQKDEEDDIGDDELTAELSAISWSHDDDDDEVLGQHYDTKLQTALTDPVLFRNLLKIHNDAKSYIEEQGVNTLFLALGFLHWYEADSSENLRRAPLLLLPVKLERKGAGDDFKLSYNGDELMPNLSLYAKIKADFSIDLSGCGFDEDAFSNSEEAIENFYNNIGAAISRHGRWQVAKHDIALGFFSFGKFLMFNDLDPKNWPATHAPEAHPIIRGLLSSSLGGDQASDSEVRIDDRVKPGEVSFVKDADSSQTEALLSVIDGKNLVIQGPPGTGKSQTITNIIAELISRKKTVLFVAEKMAALEVVKRRLDECHLGDAVLELHSQKATRMSVIKELERTLNQGQPQAVPAAQDFARLHEVQQYLNQYCDVVSQTIGNSGLTYPEILGRYMRLKREREALPLIEFKPMLAWTQAEQSRYRELVEDLALHLQDMGCPTEHAFWGSAKAQFSPIEQEKVSALFTDAQSAFQNLQPQAQQLAALLNVPQPETVAQLEELLAVARFAVSAPELSSIDLTRTEWLSERETIQQAIAAGEQLRDSQAQGKDKLIDAAWEADLLGVRQSLATYGDKWWRVFSGKYRAAKNSLQGLMQTEMPKAPAEQLALVDSVLKFQQSKKRLEQQQEFVGKLYGSQWRAEASNWESLKAVSEWAAELHLAINAGTIGQSALQCLSGSLDKKAIEQLLQTASLQLQQALASTKDAADIMGFAGLYDTVVAAPLLELAQKVQAWQQQLGSIYQLIRYNSLASQLNAISLNELVKRAESADHYRDLIDIFDCSWYAGLIELAYAEKPELRNFDRVKHEAQIARFKELDHLSLTHSQNELAKKIWHAMPSINLPGEMGVVRAEINKKKRHIAIRQLIERAGRAVQQIKPVFMMSPMSIASFLPPGKLDFDVVIFDEASQVKAIDAFGAILRGKQVIVVGDTRQMPPTDFFGRSVESDDESEDVAMSDIESILSLFKAAGCTEKYLRWHYRSRHESLIVVSNAEFYENRLVVFPSAGQQANATGVSFVHLPHAVYDRGKTRTNLVEAKTIAQAVIDHALQTPELSLGVAAFSVTQRDLIQVELELLRRQHPEAEAFFSAHPSEPFFVKNLENIQGDERDCIYISVGYGRVESGQMIKSFGPLNRDGGHRRLNVLITRAKLAMRVFSNFRGDEMEVDNKTSLGVRALKNFLKFAETGKLEVAYETGKAPDSAFEMEVIVALGDRGYRVEPQVGTAGYFIDIAVRDPDNPGAYILAIECDGASYHSSKSARDRDRLRQSVLEGLGWNFHRIWSTDWFRNREQELNRAVEAIEYARQHRDRKPAVVEQPALAALEMTRVEVVRESHQLKSVAYVKVDLGRVNSVNEIHNEQPEKILALIQQVVAGEAPVHIADITKRLMSAYGVVKAGARISSAIEFALDRGLRQKAIVKRGDFVYLPDQTEFPIRNRAELETAERKFERIPPEELDAALLQFIGSGFDVAADEAISGVLSAFGFMKATAKVREALEDRLRVLIKQGKLINNENLLSVAAEMVG